MDTVIWIIQGVVAAMFLMAGIMKTTQPREVLIEKIGGWVEDMPFMAVRAIGILEILGAIGIIVPMFIESLAFLVPLAAIGLGLAMIGAMLVHVNRKEYKALGVNLFLLALVVTVIVGRMNLLSC